MGKSPRQGVLEIYFINFLLSNHISRLDEFSSSKPGLGRTTSGFRMSFRHIPCHKLGHCRTGIKSPTLRLTLLTTSSRECGIARLSLTLNRINLTISPIVPSADHHPAPKPMANANAKRPRRLASYKTIILIRYRSIFPHRYPNRKTTTSRNVQISPRLSLITLNLRYYKAPRSGIECMDAPFRLKIILGRPACPACPGNGLLTPTYHRLPNFLNICARRYRTLTVSGSTGGSISCS